MAEKAGHSKRAKCSSYDKLSKLVEARILKAVFFPKWVSNPVMVKKTDGTWRMCIDFTSLNKACLKDSCSLPKMDQKVESLEGFKLKCFLDTYKGYHQIRMAREDKENTSFHIEHGTFCYEKMPCGLKNAGATYQRLTDNMFGSQLGRNIKIYVDDMVIKNKNKGNLITDIIETFDTLKKANIKLKPKKCTLGVESGQFLGYVITNEGIQANPKKFQAIINMASPRTLCEVQALKGIELAIQMKAQRLEVYTNSLLIAIQVKGLYEAREDIMKRSKNKRVGALSKPASSSFAHITKSVLVEVVPCRSIEVKAINTIEEMGDTWMDPVISYLTNGAFPEYQTEARKIRIKAPQYSVKQNILYRKGYLTPRLRCVGPVQADYVLREAHLGSCGAHTRPRSIAQKAARLGYNWPMMYQDATRVVETCHKLGNRHSGPFPKAPGRVKFLIVAIDYFTKWAEAEPVATITGHKKFTSVAHPQANRQTKVTNRTILQDLKTKLEKAKGQWVEELPDVRLRLRRYKRQMESYYNKKVRHHQLQICDFVLRKNEASRQEGQRKLDPN
nr:reverse transcriptase domain-containing protein [Tanacetum cinerariifolium]